MSDKINTALKPLGVMSSSFSLFSLFLLLFSFLESITDYVRVRLIRMLLIFQVLVFQLSSFFVRGWGWKQWLNNIIVEILRVLSTWLSHLVFFLSLSRISMNSLSIAFVLKPPSHSSSSSLSACLYKQNIE